MLALKGQKHYARGEERFCPYRAIATNHCQHPQGVALGYAQVGPSARLRTTQCWLGFSVGRRRDAHAPSGWLRILYSDDDVWVIEPVMSLPFLSFITTEPENVGVGLKYLPYELL